MTPAPTDGLSPPAAAPGAALVAARALPVSETFASFQGEGLHQGRSAYFIRLFGCPVHCPWCDSAETWHPEHLPAQIDRVEPRALVVAAVAARPDFVVITGGEPTIHDLRPLTEALAAQGLPVHLETSGAFRLQGRFDWVTLSPKRWRAPLPETVARADEFKLIVDGPEELDRWRNLLPEHPEGPPIWLHPEWGQRHDPDLLQRIADTVKARGAPYRAGWQIHKNYGVR
jgi:7-carboxy-7-deazaguanine synthase